MTYLLQILCKIAYCFSRLLYLFISAAIPSEIKFPNTQTCSHFPKNTIPIFKPNHLSVASFINCGNNKCDTNGKRQQDAIKDVGGFVAGHLKAGRRKNGTVLCRSMLMLDMARTLVVLKLRDSITDANIQVQRSLLILLIRLVDIIIIICKL